MLAVRFLGAALLLAATMTPAALAATAEQEDAGYTECVTKTITIQKTGPGPEPGTFIIYTLRVTERTCYYN
jgi:hypothetical protein